MSGCHAAVVRVIGLPPATDATAPDTLLSYLSIASQPEDPGLLEETRLRPPRKSGRVGRTARPWRAPATPRASGGRAPESRPALGQFWAMRDGTDGSYGSPGHEGSPSYKFQEALAGSNPTLTAI
jgi:hypothetical protein